MNFRGIATIRFNDTLYMNQLNVTSIDFKKLLKIQVRDGLKEIVDKNNQNITNFYPVSYDGLDLKI